MTHEAATTLANRLGYAAYFMDETRDAGADDSLTSFYEDNMEVSYVNLVHAWYEGYSAGAETHRGILDRARADFGPNT